MKFVVFLVALCVSGAESTRGANRLLGRLQHRQHLHHLRTQENGRRRKAKKSEAEGEVREELGDEDCRCIGFDNVAWETTLVINTDGRDIEVPYPGDVGASCKTWDADSHPFCKVDPSLGFCKEKWCYVDPKKCGISTMPKLSGYMPDARFQTMPLYYSYATCGHKDTYTNDVPKVGSDGCRCVGFVDSPGMTVANIGDKKVQYPSELGAECQAWDQGHHPECVGADQPDWCGKKWCFVDPCSCDAEVPPKESGYLGKATFQGTPVFWSYVTCGTTDTYSEDAKKAAEEGEEKATEVCEKKKEEPEEDVFGKTTCPCIGFDGIDGETVATTSHAGTSVEVSYPADLGGSCDPWDVDNHPTCKGTQGNPLASQPEWCTSKWCYVDPRNCHLKTLPKESLYQPMSKYQTLPLYYSYSTCGAKDTWTKDIPNVGVQGCRCIGIDGLPGKITGIVDGDETEYPAEVGGHCKAWDHGNHPKCKGGDTAAWCERKWCFVDPCSCTASLPPKTSKFLPDTTFQGRQVFWSYAACGDKDAFSTKEHQEESKAEIKKLCSAQPTRTTTTTTTATTVEAKPAHPHAKSGSQALTPVLALVTLCAFFYSD